jgi:hypothetical protein
MRLLRHAIDLQQVKLRRILQISRQALILLVASAAVLSLELLSSLPFPSWLAASLVGLAAAALGALAGSLLSSTRARSEKREFRDIQDQLERYRDEKADR